MADSRDATDVPVTPDTVVGDRLSVRSANALWRMLGDLGRVTYAQVATVAYRDLQRQAHVGPKSIREVRSMLHAAGLDLRDVPESEPLAAPETWVVRSLAARGGAVLVTLDGEGPLLRVPLSAERAKALHVGMVVRLGLEEVADG